MPLETTKFDGARHLATMEEQFAYLDAALDQSDPSFSATAIGDVARARHRPVARETGLSREAIYKAFKPSGHSTIGTISKAMKASRLKLTGAAINSASPASRTKS
jgi:probable addiction module antidote protein